MQTIRSNTLRPKHICLLCYVCVTNGFFFIVRRVKSEKTNNKRHRNILNDKTMFRNGKVICYHLRLYAANNDIFGSRRTRKKKNNFARLYFRTRSTVVYGFLPRTRFHRPHDRPIVTAGNARQRSERIMTRGDLFENLKPARIAIANDFS
jgi:hypothetical protein